MEQRLNRVILTYLFVPRVDWLDYFDAAMLPRCRIVLLLKYVSLVAVSPLLTGWVEVQRILSCIQIQSRGSDTTSAVPAAFYRRASRVLRSCIHFVRSAICRLCSAVFNGINSPIFSWRQFLIESGVKAFISINTERLIVKIEKLINAIPNVPLGSYYRHGLSGITSGRDRAT